MATTFASVLRVEHVFGDIPVGDRDSVIRAVLDRLVAVGAIPEDESITVFRAILKRERTGTTGIGRGIAIPHCKTAAVTSPLVAFGKILAPIDYGAADGDPVHSLCVVVSPADAPGVHVEILKSVALLARDDYNARVLKNTFDPASLFDFFRELDGKA
ncbi:MAG: PTS sugar transporter subunit IIA [Planctomycetes bacterium]|nr:PTS sugar transporter subunit IIA [Planctomycetota bacterium]